jgi:hypothetical protein
MSWLTFRQHRVQIAAMLGLAVVLVIGMTFATDYATRIRAEIGVDSCVPPPNTNVSCVQLDNEWRRRTLSLNYLFYAVYVLPALVASYVGGPLFAVEFERGTHRLAWTQSVSRMRWAAVKLGGLLLIALAAGIVLAPFGGGQRVLRGDNPSPFETFEIEGLALISYFGFGLAAGAFAGAWSRRILAGMLVGLLIFGGARVAIHNLRPMYQDAATVPFPGYQAFPFETFTGIPRDAWVLGVKGFDLEGRPVPDERVTSLVQEYFRTPHVSTQASNDSTFLLEHGVIRRLAYQPADRFWTFQAIEAAIFTALAALFALLTLWRVRTRDA